MDSPNPVKVTPYLTIIPGRLPRQKMHSTLGHAHNAINTALWQGRNRGVDGSLEEMAVFQFTGVEWVEIEHYPVGTKERDLPWRKGK